MLNICGCLVHAMPEMTGGIVRAIAGMEGCEVHSEDGGRIVVTIEDTDNLRASEQIMALHQIPGVLTVTLTYHHFEELAPESGAVAPGLI